MGGLHHLRLTATLHGLSLLYWEQGKYVQAEPLGLRALSIWEQAQEAEHAGLARLINGLAMVYFNQGKYAQATLSDKQKKSHFLHPFLPEKKSGSERRANQTFEEATHAAISVQPVRFIHDSF